MGIPTAPKSVMTELDTLFIEVSKKTCNLRCKHCFIDFSTEKYFNNFIELKKVEEALSDLQSEKIKYIHLTGAEPLLHPYFTKILTLCLKHATTVIHTNGYLLSRNKASYWKNLLKENDNGLLVKLSLDNYEENVNDKLREFGSFHKTTLAIRNLLEYEIKPIITVVNHFGEDELLLKEKMSRFLETLGLFEAEINVLPLVNKKEFVEFSPKELYTNLDCSFGRMLTDRGVYNCPMSVDDYRGRAGASFKDFSKKATLDSPACSYCMMKDKPFFGIRKMP